MEKKKTLSLLFFFFLSFYIFLLQQLNVQAKTRISSCGAFYYVSRFNLDSFMYFNPWFFIQNPLFLHHLVTISFSNGTTNKNHVLSSIIFVFEPLYLSFHTNLSLDVTICFSYLGLFIPLHNWRWFFLYS